jgi:hypothetical protein
MIVLPAWAEPLRDQVDFGPDFSSYNGTVNPPNQAKTKSAGCSWVATRIGSCTGSTTTGILTPFLDSMAKTNLENTRLVGIDRPDYQDYRLGRIAYQLIDYTKPEKIRENLIKALVAAGIPEFDPANPVTLCKDLEQKLAHWKPICIPTALECLAIFNQTADELGFPHIWYSNASTYQQILVAGMPQWLKDDPFWLAWIVSYAPPANVNYSWGVQFTFKANGPTYGTNYYESKSCDMSFRKKPVVKFDYNNFIPVIMN